VSAEKSVLLALMSSRSVDSRDGSSEGQDEYDE